MYDGAAGFLRPRPCWQWTSLSDISRRRRSASTSTMKTCVTSHHGAPLSQADVLAAAQLSSEPQPQQMPSSLPIFCAGCFSLRVILILTLGATPHAVETGNNKVMGKQRTVSNLQHLPNKVTAHVFKINNVTSTDLKIEWSVRRATTMAQTLGF